MSKKSSTFAPAFGKTDNPHGPSGRKPAERLRTEERGESVAQQVEHIPFKDGVLGSSPSWFTEQRAIAALFLYSCNTNLSEWTIEYIAWSIDLTISHYYVNYSARNDNNLLGCITGEVTCCIFVSKNEFLHFVLRRVLRALQGEPHLTVELHRVLLRIFYQIGFVQFWPLGIDDK